MKTVLLDRTTWDLCLDLSGNIAVASNPYSRAQDAASAIKLFRGELYYKKEKGVPYFSQILGHAPPPSLMKQAFVTAALTVPEVVSAQAFIASIENRQVRGQVQVRDTAGTVTAASF